MTSLIPAPPTVRRAPAASRKMEWAQWALGMAFAALTSACGGSTTEGECRLVPPCPSAGFDPTTCSCRSVDSGTSSPADAGSVRRDASSPASPDGSVLQPPGEITATPADEPAPRADLPEAFFGGFDAGFCFASVATDAGALAACPCLYPSSRPVHEETCVNVDQTCTYAHHQQCWVAGCTCAHAPDGTLRWVCSQVTC